MNKRPYGMDFSTMDEMKAFLVLVRIIWWSLILALVWFIGYSIWG